MVRGTTIESLKREGEWDKRFQEKREGKQVWGEVLIGWKNNDTRKSRRIIKVKWKKWHCTVEIEP